MSKKSNKNEDKMKGKLITTRKGQRKPVDLTDNYIEERKTLLEKNTKFFFRIFKAV